MYRYGLRKRVAIACAICVAVLSMAWGFAFFSALKLTEDRVFERQLERAAESYPQPPLTLRGYDQASNLPEPLRDWARTGPEQGLYEFQSEDIYVAVVPPDDKHRPPFLVLDAAGIEAASSEDWLWLLAVLGVVVTLGSLGFGLGLAGMRRALAPVAHLAKVVADIDPEKLSAEEYKRIEPHRFGDDEVGLLARTVEKTLERISAFIERERMFTGSASHELRTPVTVIAGAVELLEQSKLSAADREIVDRVKRATVEMKTTIEMFLCLARETDDGEYAEQIPVMPVVDQAIDQQRHLLTSKFVDIEVNDKAAPVASGHPQAFAIAVNNLVRNAFEHTLYGQGPITIEVTERELFVTNRMIGDATEQTRPTETSCSQGYGLGLGIVQRLCEHNGWTFSLRADEAHFAAGLSW
jgi:signal transduction histidine kinase